MDRPTIKDVARAAGVSINTVSRALNAKPDVSPKTRRQVLEVAKRLNYMPNKLARGLRSNKTGVIGVIVADIANPFFSAVVKGMGKAAKELGYSIILQDTSEDYENEEEAIQIMISEQVDGLLITPVQTEKRSIRMLQQSGIPFVLVARHFSDVDTDYVVADDVQGGYLATTHLLEKGHEKIAFINGPSYNSSAIERFKGYKKALAEHDIELYEELIRNGALTMEDGYTHGRALLMGHDSRPTALFTFSDFVALGAMKAVHEVGLRIPGDIAIVGYDDIDFAFCLESPLTTIRFPKREMGEEVVSLLERKMNGEECHSRLKMPVELVVRQSSLSTNTN
jgi:LacI family transcriptional regulator